MTRRLIIALLMLPALLLGSAVTSAQAGQPGIRSTKEYQELKSYVSVLAAKRNNPATQSEINKFKDTLAKRRAAANGKVREQYRQKIVAAKAQRQNKREKVRKMRNNRRAEVAALKQNRQSKLDQLAADKRAALTRIDNEYDGKLNALQKDLTKLQRKLGKATKPSVRSQLKAEIATVQDQISTQQRAKQNDISLVNTRYNNNVEAARERSAAEIAKAKAQSLRNIQEAETALREVFAAKKEGAQSRKAGDFQLIKTEDAKGLAYIKEIPVKGAPQS